MKTHGTIQFPRALAAAALALLSAAPALNAATPFFINGPLSIARAYHTTTLLSNGKLLVAGGYNGNAIAVSELYDPTTGTSATNGAMAAARYQHTATLLPNGKLLVAGGLNGGGEALASAELYDPVSGTWRLTGAMNTARYQHTANLLADGKVLVAGGQVTNNVVTNSAEIYDPATGVWTPTGPMGTPRYSHTATLLADGTVLAAGGLTPGITPTTELYDPVAGTWSPTGSMNFDRSEFTATRLTNGQVLAAAGIFLGDISSAELYNPATKTWTVTGSLHTARVYHTATLLPDGKALVVSGYYNGGAGLTTNSAEIYDPVAMNWTVAGLVNTGRAFHTATQLPGGQVVLVGGYNGTYLASVETYEPTNGNWTATGSMSVARYHHTLTLLPNGQVLAAGGGGSNAPPTITELYNPGNGNWIATAGAMNLARLDHTATLLPSGQVLVAGGYNGTYFLPSAEVFDPTSGFWTQTNSMYAARGLHSATLLLNGKVLVAGGYNGSAAIAETETYDPSTGTWTTNGRLNTARWQHTGTLLPSGQVLVAGGYDTNGMALKTVETYDPSNGTWTTNNPMNTARGDHTATLLPNGKLLVAGGYNNTNGYLSNAEVYDPASGTWTLTGSMNFARLYHVATLLTGGQVLVAAGENAAGVISSAEVYDPATGTWFETSSLSAACYEAAATLLPSGKVLFAGGSGASSVLSSAQLFDAGLGFSPNLQPVITTITSPVTLEGNVAIAGSGFRGDSEGSGGNNSQDSPADFPLVQLHGLESGQSAFFTVTNWTTNSLATVPVTNFPMGWALATVMVDGIPSPSTLLNVGKATATVTLANLAQYYDGAAEHVSVTTVPPGLAVTVTYDGSTVAPTNTGSYTVIALVNDANYQGGATNTLQIEYNIPAVSPGSSIYEGSMVTLAESALVPGTFSYQWQTDGGTGGNLTNIPGATGTNLVMTLTNAGSYNFDVIVSNSYGTTTSSVVQVEVLPPESVTVNTASPIAAMPPQGIGVCTAVYDNVLIDSSIAPLLAAAGITAMRTPGGSYADVYDWENNTGINGAYVNGNDSFLNFMNTVVLPAGGAPIITVNYGSNPANNAGGDTNVAAAWVNYANNTKHYGVKYWEIGNEIYGNGYLYSYWDWEYDLHFLDLTASDRVGQPALSPAAYGTNAIQFISAMKARDTNIQCGVFLNPPLTNWNASLLNVCGGVVDFVIIHWYPDGDTPSLLASTATIAPTAQSTFTQLTNLVGAARASQMSIAITETGAGNVTGAPVSLFTADNYLTWIENRAFNVDYQILHTDILQNDQTPGHAYYGAQMAHILANVGDTLLNTTSSQSLLRVHATAKQDGSTGVMLINDNPSIAIPAIVTISGTNLSSTGIMYQFGLTNFIGADDYPSYPVSTQSIAGLGNRFTVTVPAYTIIDVLVSPIPPASPVISSVIRNTNGGLTLHLSTSTNFSSRIYAATNLTPPIAWQPIYTNTNGGIWQFTDTNTSGIRVKYYRLSTP